MKTTTALLLFGILCPSVGCTSQTLRSSSASPYLGFAAYSNNHVDVFSFHSNQAALARIKNLSAGIYSEKRFFLNELTLYNALVALPTRTGNFALDACSFGFTDYRETQLGLAYARSLGSKIDVGARFNYYSMNMPAYGSASSINFDVGAIFRLTEKLNAGLHLYNPTRSKLGRSEEEKIPASYSAGLGFEPSDKVFASVEIEKEEDQRVNVNAGLQYQFLSQFLTRLGVSTSSSLAYLGIGFKWRSMRLDAVASYHPQLGITPALLIMTDIKKQH